MSVDLLSNIKYNKELEQFQPRGDFNFVEDAESSLHENTAIALENQADDSVQSALQNFMVKGFNKNSNNNSNTSTI